MRLGSLPRLGSNKMSEKTTQVYLPVACDGRKLRDTVLMTLNPKAAQFQRREKTEQARNR